MTLAGKTVVVIGGSSGMGLATARAALGEGATVIITGRAPERLSAAQAQLGSNVRAMAADASDEDAMRKIFGQLPRVDHAFVTAADLVYGPTLTADTATLRAAIDARFWGAFFTAKYAAAKMPADGSITFLTGVAGRKPLPGGAVIAASCSAVEALGRGLAVELAPIRVNTVAPGLIDTPLHNKMTGKSAAERFPDIAKRLPVKRMGQAEDVAAAVLFLMKNPFVTGITLTIDGGHLLV
jgi:NAD(P)-dependent dehydrogenase (short-subunit alcohol dehydrogenase family)